MVAYPPFIQKPKEKIPVGEHLVNPRPRGCQMQKSFHNPQHHVHHKQHIPPLLAVRELQRGLPTKGHSHPLAGRNKGYHALDGNLILPHRHFYRHPLVLHNAHKAAVNKQLVWHIHCKLAPFLLYRKTGHAITSQQVVRLSPKPRCRRSGYTP